MIRDCECVKIQPKLRPKSRSKSRSPRSYSKNYRYKSLPSPPLENYSIEWDISLSPLLAKVNGMLVTESFLNRKWCSENSMKLLLPISVNVNNTGDPIVLFEETIRTSKITIFDVLDKIWSFYNTTAVSPEDLTYVAVSNPMKAFSNDKLQSYCKSPFSINTVHFKDFLQNQTKFKTLKQQDTNTFVLEVY